MPDKIILIRDNIEVEINNTVIGHESRADGDFPVVSISDEDDKNILNAFSISNQISFRIGRPIEGDTNFVKIKIKPHCLEFLGATFSPVIP